MNFQNIFCLRLLKLKMIGYIDPVRCKIIELALVGYNYTSAYSPLRAFFMRKISMLPHSYGEAGEGHLRMCGSLVYLSTNPFQLCHPHLVVTGKAPKQTQGAHSS
ncbi:hypothetical protein KWF52_04820 [Acinetobacter pittii]|uniref:hypothetical protein n=1 Tax=Acinetobacter calcoaceticus/baumannii complex TaxID=909768 RepID=UPI0004F53B03|nr:MULTISPECIES: hypothetical protein [Acinetobacter]KAF0599898.1 hypothetical protein AB71190_03281 [Acinetobacter baumannii]KJX73661.1 hypothetical protein WH42_03180 [Acinetobacter baumannii]KQE63041.1 hypothetical protein APD49_02840 [Acinetobacter pittii]MBJ8489773.1 hypothetical protein [Acinetobacter pittii]MBJ8610810.1 hypothetical protein [Acinetobacter pittii]